MSRVTSIKSLLKNDRRFLTFVDILGFKSLVERSKSDTSLARRIEDAVDEAIYWVRGCKPHPTGHYAWKLKTFSDCLTFSQPESSLGLLNMFEAVAYLVRRMILRKLPVRGGIALDHHIQFRLTMPSPALVSAYALEQSAIYPRIKISEQVVEFVASDVRADLTPEIAQYIAFDESGNAFLNHLICDEDDDIYPSTTYLAAERDFLLDQLALDSVEVGVWEKFSWLAAFHDWCVRTTSWHSEQTEDDFTVRKELSVNQRSLHRFTSLTHLLLSVSKHLEKGMLVDWSSLTKPSAWAQMEPFIQDWTIGDAVWLEGV